MLTEFAITPQVFDPRCNANETDWSGCIRELGNAMFPRTAASPVLLSDLAAGRWYSVTRQLIEDLNNGSESGKKSKWLLLSLLEKIKEVLVRRPACFPEVCDEEGWLAEAIASSRRDEPIHRIIATTEVSKGTNGARGLVYGLTSVRRGEMWEDVKTSGRVSMSVHQQIHLLRPMLLHARYMALVLPRLAMTEIEFACELIHFRAKSATFGAFQIDLHTVPLGGDEQNDRLCTRIREHKQFRDSVPECRRCRLLVWPSKFLDREILGGHTVESPSDGFAVRWGGSLGHVATDESPELEAKWHVYDRETLNDVYRRFYRAGNAPKVYTLLPR